MQCASPGSRPKGGNQETQRNIAAGGDRTRPDRTASKSERSPLEQHSEAGGQAKRAVKPRRPSGQEGREANGGRRPAGQPEAQSDPIAMLRIIWVIFWEIPADNKENILEIQVIPVKMAGTLLSIYQRCFFRTFPRAFPPGKVFLSPIA